MASVLVVVAIAAVTLHVSDCTHDELSKALASAIPAKARIIARPMFDAGSLSASGSCAFEADMTWVGYSDWLTSSLPEWRVVASTPSSYEFRRTSQTDLYGLMPLRIRVTVTGIPF